MLIIRQEIKKLIPKEINTRIRTLATKVQTDHPSHEPEGDVVNNNYRKKNTYPI